MRKLAEILRNLSSLRSSIPAEPIDLSTLTPRELKKLHDELWKTMPLLRRLQEEAAPIKQPAIVFDPTDPRVAGELIGISLQRTPRQPLTTTRKFFGSGIYALYYHGDFDVYRPISGTDTPIYVGKADPEFHHAQTPQEQGPKLTARLKEHLRSIRKATNLKAEDFECRLLVVKTGFEASAENYLIKSFMPIWNTETGVCYGFGKHGDKATTRKNTRSPWDTLHPGRTWAGEGNIPNPLGVEGVKRQIREHFKRYPPRR